MVAARRDRGGRAPPVRVAARDDVDGPGTHHASSSARGPRRRSDDAPCRGRAHRMTTHVRQSDTSVESRARTMRAAVVVAPSHAETNRIARPEIGPLDVRVRLQGCGVCHSNIPVWEGRPWFNYPLEPGAPGHEGWGVVDAVGDDVHGIELGQRVALLSYHAYAEFDVAPVDAVVPL